MPGAQPKQVLDHELAQPGAGWVGNHVIGRRLRRGEKRIDIRPDGVYARAVVGGVRLKVAHGRRG